MYNLLDVNEAIVESNLSVERASELTANSTGDGFEYFYYPLDETIKSTLKQEKGDIIRFIKLIN